MKLEKYVDKSNKRRKTILISISVIVLIVFSFLIFKTFAVFTENVEFPVMNGKVDYFGNSDVYFAFYEGDKELEEMPSKDNEEELVFDYGECDNGASIVWDEEAWGPMVKNLSKSKTKCSLYFRNYAAIDYIKNLPLVESEDGLYEVNHKSLNKLSDEWKQTEYRYAGENPKNYLSFNNEVWRVIGVVNVQTYNGVEQRVKIIRANGIDNQNDFGLYSWDYKLSGEGSSTSDQGSNNWPDSYLKDMLNGIYYNSLNGNCYKGNKTPEICDFKNGQVKGINDETRNMIDTEVVWNLGGLGTASVDSSVFYEYERWTSVYENRETLWSKTSEVGNMHNGIGLMYPSDYGYAIGGNNRQSCLKTALASYNEIDCFTANWLKTDKIEWLLTTYNSSSNTAFNLRPEGFVNYNRLVNDSYSVRPVVYLKKNVKIIKDESPLYGSIENPFILSIQ